MCSTILEQDAIQEVINSHPSGTRRIGLVVGTILLLALPVVAADQPTAEQLQFFESKIRPVLSENCYSCHSHKAKKLKASLYADTRMGLQTGGDTGPAIVPGHPDKSLLIKAVR